MMFIKSILALSFAMLALAAPQGEPLCTSHLCQYGHGLGKIEEDHLTHATKRTSMSLLSGRATHSTISNPSKSPTDRPRFHKITAEDGDRSDAYFYFFRLWASFPQESDETGGSCSGVIWMYGDVLFHAMNAAATRIGFLTSNSVAGTFSELVR
ncbi:hypothetical protein F5148DRAFT_1147312 [Russula earlei]|uniref:Uncharacterized protein n=1 Tax=Russula earlei TaxID=71964 RepID=A0ACC0UGT4_9AGAM|nr:hypothetical protein F5148DRAFT_1147312 [Russula earlei]